MRDIPRFQRSVLLSLTEGTRNTWKVYNGISIHVNECHMITKKDFKELISFLNYSKLAIENIKKC